MDRPRAIKPHIETMDISALEWQSSFPGLFQVGNDSKEVFTYCVLYSCKEIETGKVSERDLASKIFIFKYSFVCRCYTNLVPPFLLHIFCLVWLNRLSKREEKKENSLALYISHFFLPHVLTCLAPFFNTPLPSQFTFHSRRSVPIFGKNTGLIFLQKKFLQPGN